MNPGLELELDIPHEAIYSYGINYLGEKLELKLKISL